MTGRLLLPLSLALALLLAACAAGPKPAVTGQELRPPRAPDAPYQAVVTITNTGRGEGQAQVIARLNVRGTGITAAQVSQTVELQPGATVQLLLDLRPVTPGPYDLSVEATYPP